VCVWLLFKGHLAEVSAVRVGLVCLYVLLTDSQQLVERVALYAVGQYIGVRLRSLETYPGRSRNNGSSRAVYKYVTLYLDFFLLSSSRNNRT